MDHYTDYWTCLSFCFTCANTAISWDRKQVNPSLEQPAPFHNHISVGPSSASVCVHLLISQTIFTNLLSTPSNHSSPAAAAAEPAVANTRQIVRGAASSVQSPLSESLSSQWPRTGCSVDSLAQYLATSPLPAAPRTKSFVTEVFQC